jgi:hypothetical protein
MPRLTPSARAAARVLTGPMTTGALLAVVFIGAWSATSGADMSRLLFANGLGALMLYLALAGLFTCAAFATSFGPGDDRQSDRGRPALAFAYRLSRRNLRR